MLRHCALTGTTGTAKNVRNVMVPPQVQDFSEEKATFLSSALRGFSKSQLNSSISSSIHSLFRRLLHSRRTCDSPPTHTHTHTHTHRSFQIPQSTWLPRASMLPTWRHQDDRLLPDLTRVPPPKEATEGEQ
jgi:hypothetical protein